MSSSLATCSSVLEVWKCVVSNCAAFAGRPQEHCLFPYTSLAGSFTQTHGVVVSWCTRTFRPRRGLLLRTGRFGRCHILGACNFPCIYCIPAGSSCIKCFEMSLSWNLGTGTYWNFTKFRCWTLGNLWVGPIIQGWRVVAGHGSLTSHHCASLRQPPWCKKVAQVLHGVSTWNTWR